MALSYQQVVSDGALSSLLISLDYMDRSEISLVFDDGLSHAWSWVGSSGKQLTFSPPIPHGVTVTILRKTAIATARHKFAGGAQFKAKAVDEAIAQLLRAIQELKESSSGAGPESLVPWENIIGGPAAVAAYADAAAAAAAELARITAETYADGVVTEAEARAVAVAVAEAELAEVTAKAYADGIVTAEEARAIADAQARATVAELTAKAYADGKVTAEEARAIADATTKANAAELNAKAYALAHAVAAQHAAEVTAAADAAAKAALAETVAKAHADGVVNAEETRAIADATAKADAARVAAINAAAADATAKANLAATMATWSGVSGVGKPQDFATNGATFGVNILGQMSPANISTWIATGAIGAALIGEAAIGTAHIQDLAVSTSKIGAAAIGTAHIQDLAVSTSKIGEAAIGTAHIQDLAVSTSKIGDLQVSTLKIAGEAVVVPRYFESSASMTVTGGVWSSAVITTAPIPNVGAPVVLMFKVQDAMPELRLLRNGVPVFNWAFNGLEVFQDTYPGENPVYTIQVRPATSFPSNSATLNLRRLIQVVVTKR